MIVFLKRLVCVQCESYHWHSAFQRQRTFVENHIVGIRPFKAKSKNRGESYPWHSAFQCQIKVCARALPSQGLLSSCRIIGWGSMHHWMADHQHYDLELLPLASSLGSVWPPNKEARCLPESLAGEGWPWPTTSKLGSEGRFNVMMAFFLFCYVFYITPGEDHNVGSFRKETYDHSSSGIPTLWSCARIL